MQTVSIQEGPSVDQLKVSKLRRKNYNRAWQICLNTVWTFFNDRYQKNWLIMTAGIVQVNEHRTVGIMQVNSPGDVVADRVAGLLTGCPAAVNCPLPAHHFMWAYCNNQSLTCYAAAAVAAAENSITTTTTTRYLLQGISNAGIFTTEDNGKTISQ